MWQPAAAVVTFYTMPSLLSNVGHSAVTRVLGVSHPQLMDTDSDFDNGLYRQRGLCLMGRLDRLGPFSKSYNTTPTRSLDILFVQGTTKRRLPGSVNVRKKNCVLLPAAGSRTQFFHLIFTKPGRRLLVVPCTWLRDSSIQV